MAFELQNRSEQNRLKLQELLAKPPPPIYTPGKVE